MKTRVFKIPPDFLSCDISPAPDLSFVDPLAPAVPAPAPLPPHKTSQNILEAVGITFPEGAAARFNPNTSLLSVTNTDSNLDLVEAYVESLRQQMPATIAYTVTVIEGPGELIRQVNAAASRSTNAAEELALLLGYAKNPGSNVHIVGDAYIETKPGTRASSEAVCEHSYVSELTMDAKSRASVTQEMRQTGLKLEIDPTLGADGVTLETTLSIELHPAPPRERQVSMSEPISGNVSEFPVTDIYGVHFTTGITSTSGSTKLVGIAKPAGTQQAKEDILWAAFLTGTVRRVTSESISFSNPVTAAQTAQAPPGLSAASFNVPDGLFENVMAKQQPLQLWFEANGIVPVKGATARHEGDVLQITNTTDNIERLAALIENSLSHTPKAVAFTLHTVQAPASFLRELTHQHAAVSDHHEMWAAVEAAVARGEATFINSAFLEAKSGTRAHLTAACEHEYLSEFGTDAKGLPHLVFKMRPVGSDFEIEATFGYDAPTVEITCSHELHSAAPMTRREHFRDAASRKNFEMPATDFYTARSVMNTSMAKGSIKLISLNQPTGREDAGMLWATFLKCDVVAQVAKARTAPKSVDKPKPLIDPNAWNTRMQWVPPDFLSSGGDAAPTAQADSFAASAAEGGLIMRRKTAKQILEGAGIAFPEGATASFNPATSVLFVKNTNENLALVDRYIESILICSPKNLAFTVHVLQGSGPLLRRLTAQAASKSDHRAELDELLAAVMAGVVQHLDTARIETKAGTRATARQGCKHSAINNVSVNDKGEPVFAQEMRNVGLNVELEATVGADGIMVELAPLVEFHTAEPREHREYVIDTQGRRLEFPLTDYQVARLTTGGTLQDGVARLLALYKPTGKAEFEKEDVLQAIFITCDFLRVGE